MTDSWTDSRRSSVSLGRLVGRDGRLCCTDDFVNVFLSSLNNVRIKQLAGGFHLNEADLIGKCRKIGSNVATTYYALSFLH